MGLRMQPRNEKFFSLFGKAGSNVVESAAIPMGFVAAPHERCAELAKRLHDTEHAGDDTTSVGEPDQGGGQDETASIRSGTSPEVPPRLLQRPRAPGQNQTMRGMVLEAPGQPLQLRDLPVPSPGPDQVLLQVSACGVCRTDLHVVDGELNQPKLPLVIGHQIVGTVVAADERAERFQTGQRVGVPWLGWTDGDCRFCRRGLENLCERALFTGYQIDGGYAEHAVADQRFCFPLPEEYPDLQAAPLLCAGLIGYRSLVMAGDAQRLGLYGFGASAHIIAQAARYRGQRVFAFTRAGDADTQRFALELGAEWAGGSDSLPPEQLDAAIIFAPVGSLVPAALRAVAPAGVVVCAGIHMSDIPSFPYELLWQERQVRSVANLTRRDGEEFLSIAPKVPIHTEVETYRLEAANQALDDLRNGRFRGAAVLAVNTS